MKKKDEIEVLFKRLVHQMSQRLKNAKESKVEFVVVSKNDMKRLKAAMADTSDTGLMFRSKPVRVSPNANDGDPVCVLKD